MYTWMVTTKWSVVIPGMKVVGRSSPKPVGWITELHFNGQVKELRGFHHAYPYKQAPLLPIMAGLRELKIPSHIEILTPSDWVLYGINVITPIWVTSGWSINSAATNYKKNLELSTPDYRQAMDNFKTIRTKCITNDIIWTKFVYREIQHHVRLNRAAEAELIKAIQYVEANGIRQYKRKTDVPIIHTT